MSLKTAFASVLKAMRANRGLSQKHLAEVSSRTYISKLERGQCSPTLEMVTALSAPLSVSPLTLIALTIGAQSGEHPYALVNRLQLELDELEHAGVLNDLQMSNDSVAVVRQKTSLRRSRPRPLTLSSQQTEFCFTG